MRLFTVSILALVSSLSACGGGEDANQASVFKAMGTVGCSVNSTALLAAMRTQLVAANVKVEGAACGNDGRAYPAACDVPDGQIGIFKIPADQVQTAVGAGYARLETLPGAKVIACN